MSTCMSIQQMVGLPFRLYFIPHKWQEYHSMALVSGIFVITVWFSKSPYYVQTVVEYWTLPEFGYNTMLLPSDNKIKRTSRLLNITRPSPPALFSIRQSFAIQSLSELSKIPPDAIHACRHEGWLIRAEGLQQLRHGQQGTAIVERCITVLHSRGNTRDYLSLWITKIITENTTELWTRYAKSSALNYSWLTLLAPAIALLIILPLWNPQ